LPWSTVGYPPPSGARYSFHGTCMCPVWSEKFHLSTREKSALPAAPLIKQGMCHTVASLAIHIITYLKAKKNYGNSNISPCKNIIFKKILFKKPKSFKTLELYN